MSLSFKTTPEDFAILRQIAARADELAQGLRVHHERTRVDWLMDLTTTHANGCPLDLPKLLAAEGYAFSHDVFGIARHLDRETGELGECFIPRCALPSPTASEVA